MALLFIFLSFSHISTEQVLSDQAEQVNTKRNNTNNLTAYGQKMINDSNIINMIPKNKDIRAV